MYHSHIHEYVKCTCYVHTYITQNIGISKFEKHVTTSQFRYETFYYLLSLEVFRHKEREKGTIFLFWLFYLPPPHLVRHLPKASTSKGKPTVFFRGRSQLHWLFQNLPKSSARFRCVTSPALCNPVSHLWLLWQLWVTRPLFAHAREHLR